MMSISLSVCPFVCLSVCPSPKMQKTRFSQKISNLELWCLLTTYRKLCKLNWAFQRTHYWIPTVQDGWDTPFWKSTWRHFFLPRVVRFGYNFSDWYRMTCRLRWCVEMETRSRIPIWRTYVCVNSMACHPRATYHIAGCCHLVNSLARFQSHIPRCRVQSPDEINVVIMLHCRV